MYWFDTTILALLVVGALLGAWSGLVGQLARILCMGASIYGSVLLHEPITNFLRERALQDANIVVVRIVAYFAVFASTYLILHCVMRLARAAVREAELEGFDRLLGALFGAVKMTILLSVICLGLANFHHPISDEIMTRSNLAGKFADGAEHVVVMIPEDYKAYLQERIDSFREHEAVPRGF
jgi:membrane protein required for colicin V production